MPNRKGTNRSMTLLTPPHPPAHPTLQLPKIYSLFWIQSLMTLLQSLLQSLQKASCCCMILE